MRVKYSESFGTEAPEADVTMRLIRKVVQDRLAEEIARRIKVEKISEIE